LCVPLLACWAAAWGVGWWLDCSDAPVKSDLMVVLAGNYSRPLAAADFYREGYAPEVWLSVPYRSEAEERVRALGIALPTEESVDRDILVKSGVPADKIHLYGERVLSTLNEALALDRAAELKGKSILLVTSRTHARRARWIFRRTLPHARVRVAASPYDRFTRRWWRDRHLAQEAVLEMTKALFYLFGGGFIQAGDSR